MFRISRIDKNSRRSIIDYAKSEVSKHIFAYYDLQYDFEHTTVYSAFENEKLAGYILIYTGSDVTSVVLEAGKSAAKTLVKYAPKNHFIMHTTPNLKELAKRSYPKSKHYIEDWMFVKKSEARFFKSRWVRRLHTRKDAELLAELLSARKDRSERMLRRYVDWIGRMPLYGTFNRGNLVSYAGSFIQLPELWMIGGVFTSPEHRNKGYALCATSAITKEALQKADAAALFVRSDNLAAISVYEKIGYKKIGEKLWVDVGTGLKP